MPAPKRERAARARASGYATWRPSRRSRQSDGGHGAVGFPGTPSGAAITAGAANSATTTGPAWMLARPIRLPMFRKAANTPSVTPLTTLTSAPHWAQPASSRHGSASRRPLGVGRIMPG
jgi:hypothetical protein